MKRYHARWVVPEREPLSVDPELRARVASAADSLAAWERAATWIPATVGSVS